VTRVGKAAADWGRANSEVAPDGLNWFRRCKMFVRLCFAVPSDGTPDAGRAWDQADFRHREGNPMAIPAWVPVFWEQPTVADHVALSIGGGLCLSNDFLRGGRVDVCKIDDITRGWGGTLLGWTEDIDGVRVWSPPAPKPEPEPEPKPTRVQLARVDVWDAIALLDKALEAGRGDEVQEFRRDLRRALRNGPKK
jgi:hypothetical protein